MGRSQRSAEWKTNHAWYGPGHKWRAGGVIITLHGRRQLLDMDMVQTLCLCNFPFEKSPFEIPKQGVVATLAVSALTAIIPEE